ncbi:hypothetical protein DL240490_01438 [Mycobacterium marinum]|nr:hypothetical protein DL240490_01438 [Mycobacterium marinum]
MAPETSSVPAASTVVVGVTAAALAAPSDEPIPAMFAAAALNASGATTSTADIAAVYAVFPGQMPNCRDRSALICRNGPNLDGRSSTLFYSAACPGIHERCAR